MDFKRYDPTLWEKIRIHLTGTIEIGEYTKPGWSGYLMFYAFHCPRHGYVVDYEHTKGVCCPFCADEVREESKKRLHVNK